MRTVLALAKGEAVKPCIVYNGDMHWFDATREDFGMIEELAKDGLRLSGNVELELTRKVDIGVGCGCAYPPSVSNAAVSRSNQIHALLKDVVRDNEQLISLIAARPVTVIIEVSGSRVAVTHGDEKEVAGWGCSYEAMRERDRQGELGAWLLRHNIKVLATTHTCSPVAVALSGGAVINNGAAGLPNFRNRPYGLITRVSVTTHPDALYRASVGGLFIEAIPVKYSVDALLSWFDTIWPEGSPAAVSYRQRIIDGLDQDFEDVLLGGFAVCAPQ
jgi:predicted phosphodiesterase